MCISYNQKGKKTVGTEQNPQVVHSPAQAASGENNIPYSLRMSREKSAENGRKIKKPGF